MTSLLRAMHGLSAAFGLLAAATVVIAQGIVDPAAVTIERLIGGGILITAAILIARWSRQAGHDARITLTDALGQTQKTLEATIAILEAERAAWEGERQALRNEAHELRTLLIEERNLRISLERAGIKDRRRNGHRSEEQE